MKNSHLSKALDRLIDSLLKTVENDLDFPTAEKLALLRQNRPKAEAPRLLFRRLLAELKESQRLAEKTKLQANPSRYILISLREAQKLTQAEAAQRLDVSLTIYRYYEAGYLRVNDAAINRLFRQERRLNRVDQLQNKPYSRAEYIEIIRRQKPADDYVPYAETLGAQWIESTCYFLRRIFGYKDSR
jgi:transcriptional regulator with XRE-family HTH domain